jgi:hypothetical protein
MGDSPASLRYARLLQGWLGRFQWQHFLEEMRDSTLAPAIMASHEEGSSAKNLRSAPRGNPSAGDGVELVTGPDIPPGARIDAIAGVHQDALDAAITPRPIRPRQLLHLSLQDRTLVGPSWMTVRLSFSLELTAISDTRPHVSNPSVKRPGRIAVRPGLESLRQDCLRYGC